jgi:hypothetical protein
MTHPSLFQRLSSTLLLFCILTLAVGLAPGMASAAPAATHAGESLSATDWAQLQALLPAGSPPVQQAYLKASNTESNDFFGFSVAVSAGTVVIGAPGEDGAGTGVNPDAQANNALVAPGAVYVFVRAADGSWSQQAYLKASNADRHDHFGIAVDISGDTIVVGASGEASGTFGHPENNAAEYAGAVYVFVRSGSRWSQQAYLKAGNLAAGDLFGNKLALDGDTLVVGASKSAGAPGKSPSSASGSAYVFIRRNLAWTQLALLKAANLDVNDQFGASVDIEGTTIVVGAPFEDGGSATNARDNTAEDAGAVYVFENNGQKWEQQAYLKAATPGAGDQFGYAVAISDGSIVVGAPNEASKDGNPANNDLPFAGAAYVFTRAATGWSQQAILKASNPGTKDYFGDSVALQGERILVGADLEDSSAKGVDGDQANADAGQSGAVYLFTRSAGAWSQQHYIKASDTRAGDAFGTSLGISQDLMLVGAFTESSALKGINASPDDNYAMQSGAAYAFSLPPVLQSFRRQVPASQAASADTLVFRATFDAAVHNLKATDFLVTGGSTAQVSAARRVDDLTYDISVSGGNLPGYTGPVGLDLAPGQGILNASMLALPAGEPGLDESYQVDNTAPTVSSSQRISPNPSMVDTVDYTVTFSEPVSGLDVADFVVAVDKLAAASVQSVSGSGKEYTVRVNAGYGQGQLRLDMLESARFTDLAGNPQGGLPFNTGEIYDINRMPAPFSKIGPKPASISGPNPVLSWEPSSQATVYQYCLIYSQSPCSSWMYAGPVTSVALKGLSSGTYSWQVVALNPAGENYANGAAGASWTFMVDAARPLVTGMTLADPNPTIATSLHYGIFFSEIVNGVDVTDFRLTATNLKGAQVTEVSGSGRYYTVTVSAGTGIGTLQLDVIADGTITDLAGNTMRKNFVDGPKYSLLGQTSFVSNGVLDGWVLESGENSSQGGTVNSAGDLLLGDSAEKQQYRAFLTFDTSALPENAHILGVRLQMRKLADSAASPFAGFQSLMVDIRRDFFGKLPDLQPADFEAPASLANTTALIPVPGSTFEYQAILPNTAYKYVSTSGNTSFRLMFMVDDNNNAVANTVSFAAGEHPEAGYRPVLVVEYTLR